jgi:hypothetical protein
MDARAVDVTRALRDAAPTAFGGEPIVFAYLFSSQPPDAPDHTATWTSP